MSFCFLGKIYKINWQVYRVAVRRENPGGVCFAMFSDNIHRLEIMMDLNSDQLVLLPVWPESP